jgi:hypothetical protein
MKKAKRQLIEGQLDRFVMLDDESPQEMYNQIKKLVNKVQAYGLRRWGDRRVIDRMLRAYAIKDTMVMSLIQQGPTFKKMTPNDVLGKIINHEMLVEEANHVKNLSKGTTSSRKQDIALKASKKCKKKQIMIESSSEEDEDDDEGMVLLIKNYNKFMAKRRALKGNKGEKPRTRSERVCYNYGKNVHFIAQYPYERREEDENNKKKKDKAYTKDTKDKKYYKKKSYGEAHIGQEWDSNDGISDLDSEDMATIAIKGSSSSRKSLFPNLSKHTCLMAKESKKKVKVKGHSSPKYVPSDDDLSSDACDEAFDLGKNPTAKLDGLMKQINLRDELFEQQEKLLVQERKSNSELKKILALEKEKNEKLDQKLAKSKETTTSLESSIGALQKTHDALQKIHKDFKVQFDVLWSSFSSTPSSDLDRAKASTSNGCDRCYNVNINAICAQGQHSNVEQVLIESCDEAISKMNNHLKLEVKKLEQKVSMLEKQAKVQPSQDNRRNMVNKLEKGKTVSKLAPQQQMKPIHHKKEEKANIDEKIEYVRSVFLNARRLHIKNDIVYKNGDKRNSRVNSNGKVLIKFTKANSHQEKKQSLNNTNHVSYASYVSYHEFDASDVLMGNKFGRVVTLYVGPHHKRAKTCVWVPKCLVTKLKGPKQI